MIGFENRDRFLTLTHFVLTRLSASQVPSAGCFAIAIARDDKLLGIWKPWDSVIVT